MENIIEQTESCEIPVFQKPNEQFPIKQQLSDSVPMFEINQKKEQENEKSEEKKSKKYKSLITINVDSESFSCVKGSPSTVHKITLKDSLLKYSKENLMCGRTRSAKKWILAVHENIQQKIENYILTLNFTKIKEKPKKEPRNGCNYKINIKSEKVNFSYNGIVKKGEEVDQIEKFKKLIEFIESLKK